MSGDTLDITLGGREYHVACRPGERQALLEAVGFLDAKMAEIGRQTRSSGERLAVMTALNLAAELLAARLTAAGQAAFDTQSFQRRIEAIETRLDAALAEQQEDLF